MSTKPGDHPWDHAWEMGSPSSLSGAQLAARRRGSRWSLQQGHVQYYLSSEAGAGNDPRLLAFTQKELFLFQTAQILSTDSFTTTLQGVKHLFCIYQQNWLKRHLTSDGTLLLKVVFNSSKYFIFLTLPGFETTNRKSYSLTYVKTFNYSVFKYQGYIYSLKIDIQVNDLFFVFLRQTNSLTPNQRYLETQLCVLISIPNNGKFKFQNILGNRNCSFWPALRYILSPLTSDSIFIIQNIPNPTWHVATSD